MMPGQGLHRALFNAPQPRSQLYTNGEAYRKGALAALFGWGYESDDTQVLERELSGRHSGHAAIAMPMARVGIYLVLKNLIQKRQKVILSPYTISDVVNMVVCAGGVPLFADIEEGGSCNIDADAVLDLLDSHDDVGAVLVTHFYGLICNIRPILVACRERGIPVVEDAAQAFGATLDGSPAGTLGEARIFSFGLLKNVTGFVGGAVITKNRELEAKIRADLSVMSIFPRSMFLKKLAKGAVFDIATLPLIFSSSVYWIFRAASARNIKFFDNKLETDSNPVAYDSFPESYAHQMSGVQANIIRGQFEHCEQQTRERIAKAEIYHEGLKDLPGIELPPMRVDGSHIYLYYSILCERRDRLAQWMTQNFRDVQISHHRNCASMACFATSRRDCLNAEHAARSVIYLPTYPGYSQLEVVKNIEAIRQCLAAANQ
jgi:perosamine synthetase